MKARLSLVTVLVVTLTMFCFSSTAFAIGWLSPEWYARYYQPQQPEPTPEPAPQPEPAPEPEPAPQPEPTPDNTPGQNEQTSEPNSRTSTGWLSKAWYEKYYGSQQASPEPTPEPAPEKPDNNSAGLTAQEQRMLELINRERTRRGIPAVKLDMAITEIARLKSQDMIDNNYFAHKSPTYGRVNNMLDAAGVKYRMAGDILAKTSTVDRALELYMGSSIHQAHLLLRSYTHAGVGIKERPGGGIMVTVIFVQR